MSAAGDLDRMWTVEQPQQFAWRSWDDEVVLYDDRTGDTHYFDAASTVVFEQLLLGPQSLRELLCLMAQRLHVIADGELEAMVENILLILREKRVAAPVV